jgi:hypothetical protein
MGDRSLREAPHAGAPAGLHPLDAVADLVELVGGEGDRSRRFLGGVVAGALVGAAIVGAAGAAIVRRREWPPEMPAGSATTRD